MGKKDRERYFNTGKVFRDGKLVDKEEWLRAHPTKTMLQETKKEVKAAVTEEMESRFNAPYQCSKCNRTHKSGGKIHHQHLKFKE